MEYTGASSVRSPIKALSADQGAAILSNSRKGTVLFFDSEKAQTYNFVFFGKSGSGMSFNPDFFKKKLCIYVLHSESSEENRRFVSTLTNAVVYYVEQPFSHEKLREIMLIHKVEGIFVDSWWR